MRKVLKEEVYQELVKQYEEIGRVLKPGKQLRYGRLIEALERMDTLLIEYSSWERVE